MVDCSNVRKIYRQGEVEVKALDDINFFVDKGEFMALAGPSGSGKTTLLNLIGGLDNVTAGKIMVHGEEITRMKQSALTELRLKKIGFVFQSYNLIPVLSAVENVEFVLMLQGVSRKERLRIAEEMLVDVGLKDQLHRRPAEMSGGQQQRVAVARSIAHKPSIVLADEPTANLDSTNAEHLLDLMKELNDRMNVTFIFSTHDSAVINRAHRVVRLKDGRIVEDSTREPNQ